MLSVTITINNAAVETEIRKMLGLDPAATDADTQAALKALVVERLRQVFVGARHGDYLEAATDTAQARLAADAAKIG